MNAEDGKTLFAASTVLQSEDVAISFHDKEVPPFVEAELERLYESIHCSLAFLRQFRPLEQASTYVARKGGRPVAVLLFRCEKRKVEVLNEMIALDEEEIRCFAGHVFARFSSVSAISFPAIQTSARKLPYPCQRYNETEDFVMALPASPDAYTALLGKATRDYLKRYGRKISRSFPSLTHRIYRNEEVDEQHVLDIIGMSRARMEGKKRQFALDEDAAKGLVKLAKRYGFVNAVSIDGCLCAGSLNYRVGSHHFTFINAHTPEYDDYRLGMLCYYLTIRESIMHGAKTFHMGKARYEYKKRLLGVQQDFDRLVIYRSYRHLLLNADGAAQVFFNAHVRRLKLWLLDPQRQHGLVSRLAIHSLYVLRKLTQGRKREAA